MKTLILFSSANKHGNTAKAVEKIKANHSIEVIDIDTLTITPYRYGNDYPSDDFYSLVEKMLSSDNLVFASPIYWYSVTAPMKALIDRMTELLEVATLKPKARALESKRGFVVTSSGQQHLCPIFQGFFSELFRYFNIEYTATLHAACHNGFSIVEQDIRTFNQILNNQ
ncbi:FMN reductase [Vibrio galatheae]|uniref:FMN reductase n=1 Tax=Vibrio galatheae TaxID=579748 RepID=A0A0F4NI02_9VIBR|nr:NAD(P)H-dependent oxidoreductase [Vibrio galatheae]KJY82747.1 FMN reductase [Vibrio galatheae]